MQIKSYLKRTFIFIIFLFITLYFLAIMPRFSKHNEMAFLTHYDYAHRGLYDNTEIPENSMAAFRAALEAGYGIELDVQLTKDLIPVVFHDKDLNRVCAANKKVADLTYAELQNYTLFETTETIPQFTEVLELINGKVPVIVELKVEWDYVSTCEVIAQTLAGYDGLYTIQSFSPFALKWFKANVPDILRGQLSQNYLSGSSSGNGVLIDFALTHLLTNFLTRPDYIAYRYTDINELSLNMCQKLFKIPIFIWTIDSMTDYTTYKEQVDAMIFENFLP